MKDSKCMGCGGSLKYSPDDKALACENCGAKTPLPEKGFLKSKFLSADSIPDKQGEGTGSVKCISCGAILNVGEVIETTCPYCGSHQTAGLHEGLEYNPDSIIPFAISKKKATSIFKLWINKRKFAPNALKKKANIENMKGIYFPCWLYDYKTSTYYSGVGVKEYKDSDGNTRTTRKNISGNVAGVYTNEIEPANDMLAEYNIEMFKDYARLEQYEYDSGYILGFTTANNTNGVYDAFGRERKQKTLEIEKNIKRRLGYDRYENFVTKTNFTDVKWSYTLLPLWVCDYEFKNKKYRFLINGKTGAIIGKAPKSGWKIFFLILGILIGVGAFGILAFFLETGGLPW